MKNKVLTFDEQLKEEQRAVSEFLHFFSRDEDYGVVVYTDWTAKDVLGHVTSWHQSFARNLLDAVKGTKPTPFKGSLTDINEREVKAMSQYSIEELKRRILEAQETIDQNIGNPDVKMIAYRKGSRDYSPIEHLEVVQRHVNGHLRILKTKYKTG